MCEFDRPIYWVFSSLWIFQVHKKKIVSSRLAAIPHRPRGADKPRGSSTMDPSFYFSNVGISETLVPVDNPAGNLLKRNRPFLVTKLVMSLVDGSSGMLRNALLKSSWVKYLAPPRVSKMLSQLGKGAWIKNFVINTPEVSANSLFTIATTHNYRIWIVLTGITRLDEISRE